MSNGRIVAEQKRGLLQLTVWANQGSKGTYYTATLKRSYKDQTDQWQETKMSLPLRDFLQMARMLGWANDLCYEDVDVQQFHGEQHGAAKSAGANGNSLVAAAVETVDAAEASSSPTDDVPF